MLEAQKIFASGGRDGRIYLGVGKIFGLTCQGGQNFFTFPTLLYRMIEQAKSQLHDDSHLLKKHYEALAKDFKSVIDSMKEENQESLISSNIGRKRLYYTKHGVDDRVFVKKFHPKSQQ